MSCTLPQSSSMSVVLSFPATHSGMACSILSPTRGCNTPSSNQVHRFTGTTTRCRDATDVEDVRSRTAVVGREAAALKLPLAGGFQKSLIRQTNHAIHAPHPRFRFGTGAIPGSRPHTPGSDRQNTMGGTMYTAGCETSRTHCRFDYRTPLLNGKAAT